MALLNLRLFVIFLSFGILFTTTESCSSLAKSIACKIKATPKIKLLTKNPSGVDDGADAYHNIEDACNGKQSKRSNYTCSEGTSPGGFVCLKSSILRYIYDLGTSTQYNFQVNAIAGACHTSTSKHYLGEAVDLELDNGPTRKAQEKSYMDACKAAGGWSHGGTHVHCQIVPSKQQNHLSGTALFWKSFSEEIKDGFTEVLNRKVKIKGIKR